MAAETQYTANTGMVRFAAANTSLTGGTIGTDIFTVITGASNGTLIKTVTVKSTVSPAQGMVRLFLYDGANKGLFMEIEVDPIKQSATDCSFEKTVVLDYVLKSGYSLLASSQTSDTFCVIAEGLDITYFTSYVRPESTNYKVNVGTAAISTGNSSLTGGTPGTDIFPLLTATSGYNGTAIESIYIKATGATGGDGIVRIFIYDGSSTYYLLTEVFVPYSNQSGTYQSFEHVIEFPDKFQLEAGCSLYVATQRSDSFHIVAEALDWSYPTDPYPLANHTPSTVSFNTTEQLMQSYQIPAGLLQAGSLLGVYLQSSEINNSHNKKWRIYINSTNSLSGATLIGLFISAFAVGNNMERMFPVISDTVLECYGSTANVYPNTHNQYGTTTTVSGNITVPSLSSAGGSQCWLLISLQNASGLDTTTLTWSMVEKIF